MNTKIIRILSTEINFTSDNQLILTSGLKSKLDEVKHYILSDDLVAIPTETVYGLAANALSKSAVEKIYLAKNRPKDNPLIVHISNFSMLKSIIKDSYINPLYKKLIQKFWPGALTLLFPLDKSSLLYKSNVTCNQELVAIRYPKNKVARAIIDYCNVPLAAPSCNLSTKPSSTLAKHCYTDFNNKIKLIIDDGKATNGLESTIVNLIDNKLIVLRPGSITLDQLKHVAETEVEIHTKVKGNMQTTPGMKYKHYSPTNTKVITIYYERNKNHEYYMDKINSLVNKNNDKQTELKIVVVCIQDCSLLFEYIQQYLMLSLSSSSDDSENREKHKFIKYTNVTDLASDLYNLFRFYDELKYDFIIMVFEKDRKNSKDMYLALLNRVDKASSFFIE